VGSRFFSDSEGFKELGKVRETRVDYRAGTLLIQRHLEIRSLSHIHLHDISCVRRATHYRRYNSQSVSAQKYKYKKINQDTGYFTARHRSRERKKKKKKKLFPISYFSFFFKSFCLALLFAALFPLRDAARASYIVRAHHFV
jgi:hypothetical protein